MTSCFLARAGQALSARAAAAMSSDSFFIHSSRSRLTFFNPRAPCARHTDSTRIPDLARIVPGTLVGPGRVDQHFQIVIWLPTQQVLRLAVVHPVRVVLALNVD